MNFTIDRNNEKSFTSRRVKSIFQSNDGKIWIGSGGEGLFSYNREQNNFNKWTTDDGLASNTILAIS